MKQNSVEKIENRAKDIIAARSKIYLLEYISKSKKSVLQSVGKNKQPDPLSPKQTGSSSNLGNNS